MTACSTRSVHLRDLGNTVIVVEHDEDAILTADHVVDIGPGAGVHGGRSSLKARPPTSWQPGVADRPVPFRRQAPLPVPRQPPQAQEKRKIKVSGAPATI
jgi:excinuclease ABC subunit A